MKIAVLAYVPDVYQDAKFVAHLRKFKTVRSVYILTDGPSSADVGRLIQIPRIGPFVSEQRGRTMSDFYADWAFSSAIRAAQILQLDYFLYLETDCRLGQDYWDEYYVEQFLKVADKDALFAGTPVCWHPWSVSRKFSMEIIYYAHQYQQLAGVPMALEGDYHSALGTCLYPNGALGLYHTAECANYFERFLVNLGAPQAKQFELSANSPRNFDTHIGYTLVQRYGLDAFKRLIPIPCVYSGCRDYHLSAADRIQLLLTRQKVAVHHLKEKEYPFV